MFSVIFEVNPHGEQWDAYLGLAKMLRPELENIDGFIDNIRYRSLTRPGWILSLSGWRDEKALVRWRTRADHHDVQVKGREKVLADYHLRVGQITADNHLPAGSVLTEQRLDVTEVGDGTTITLTNPLDRDDEAIGDHRDVAALAARLGLIADASGLRSWDVFDAVLDPGNPILLQSWRESQSVAAPSDDHLRHRTVRVIRDYGMYDRRENPQYYPELHR